MCIMYTKENIYIKQMIIIKMFIINYKDDRIYYLEDQ